MFNNFKKYYENYTKYLLTQQAQMNLSDIENGFANVETFIMHVYGNILKFKYYDKYSESMDKIVFVNSSLESYENTKDLNLKSISENI